MTKEQIITRTRDELADNGVTYYSSDDLFDSFDDGYEEVALYTGVIEKYTTLPLIDDTVYYNLYESINDYIRPFAIYNPDINDWMSHKDHSYFRKIRADWERATGSSEFYSFMDFQRIAVFPHKSTANGTELEVFYKARPVKPVSLDTTPEIPEQFQVVLQFYMMSDLFAQATEWTKANIYFQKYFEKLNELDTYVNTRSYPNRIHMLREQFSGGSFYGR